MCLQASRSPVTTVDATYLGDSFLGRDLLVAAEAKSSVIGAYWVGPINVPGSGHGYPASVVAIRNRDSLTPPVGTRGTLTFKSEFPQFALPHKPQAFAPLPAQDGADSAGDLQARAAMSPDRDLLFAAMALEKNGRPGPRRAVELVEVAAARGKATVLDQCWLLRNFGELEALNKLAASDEHARVYYFLALVDARRIWEAAHYLASHRESLSRRLAWFHNGRPEGCSRWSFPQVEVSDADPLLDPEHRADWGRSQRLLRVDLAQLFEMEFAFASGNAVRGRRLASEILDREPLALDVFRPRGAGMGPIVHADPYFYVPHPILSLHQVPTLLAGRHQHRKNLQDVKPGIACASWRAIESGAVGYDEFVSEVERRAPAQPNAWADLMYVAVFHRRYEDALRFFQESVAPERPATSNHLERFLLLAQAYLGSGDLERFEDTLAHPERFKVEEYHEPYFAVLRGFAAFDKGGADEARKTLDASRRIGTWKKYYPQYATAAPRYNSNYPILADRPDYLAFLEGYHEARLSAAAPQA